LNVSLKLIAQNFSPKNNSRKTETQQKHTTVYLLAIPGLEL